MTKNEPPNIPTVDSFETQLSEKVKKANGLFEAKLRKHLKNGLQKEQYVRYLQMQYHLTKGVQHTFLSIAAHADTRAYKKLRAFLVNFGYEEEMHYKLAEKDLKELHASPGTMPFVVELWWSYQRAIIPLKPLERLGATAILENVGNFAAPFIKIVLSEATFITKKNSTFTQVHMHEELPHGDQIMDILTSVDFTEEHQVLLLQGAERATWLYVSKIYDWVLSGNY